MLYTAQVTDTYINHDTQYKFKKTNWSNHYHDNTEGSPEHPI